MSRLYTSYFARIKNLPDNVVPISICGKAPDGYTGLQYKVLAPKWSFFSIWKETHDNEYYINEYYKQVLNYLDINRVIKDLLEMIKYDTTKDICLICYEKPSDFCHRHLVADWFTSNGYKCKEFDFGDIGK